MKQHLHIFDIDGVLLSSKHRYRTITGKDGKTRIDLEHWRANEQHCDKDTPLPHADLYKKLLQKRSNFVIIATSRKMSAKDYQVIEDKIGMPHAIISRLSDKQKGGIMKAQGVLRIIEDLQIDVKTVNIYEDNAEYLKIIADKLKQSLNTDTYAYYIPSEQGH